MGLLSPYENYLERKFKVPLKVPKVGIDQWTLLGHHSIKAVERPPRMKFTSFERDLRL